MKQTIIGIIIALITVLFAVQNSATVEVKFLAWSLSSSMAMLLIIVFVTGIAAGMLVLTPAMMKKNSTIKSGLKKITELERQLSSSVNKNFK